jgi:hypothetical protein
LPDAQVGGAWLTRLNARRRRRTTLVQRLSQEFTMTTLRMITIAAVLASTLGACAQMPGSTAPAGTERMAAMDNHMKSMREMHDKMSRARTPDERQALMAEHMKLMHDGMAMMGGMHGRMGGMGPMAGAPADTHGRMQMMEKHMEMMHSMMQMMMDQMGPPPAKK